MVELIFIGKKVSYLVAIIFAEDYTHRYRGNAQGFDATRKPDFKGSG